MARLYTRAGCHLCQRAATILQRLADEGLLVWESCDIERAPELEARYGHRLPVVEIGRQWTFEGRISEFRLRRALASAP